MKHILLTLIWLYQAFEQVKHAVLITVFGFHIRCKHIPTCSQYLEAELKKGGTITGLRRGFIRLVSCW